MTKRTILEVEPGALAEYYEWMKLAEAGDVLVYWTGDLQFDRQVVLPNTYPVSSVEMEQFNTLNILADRIHEDAKDGNLYLTQKRLDFGVYEYRATRRRQVYGFTHPSQKVKNDDLALAD